MHVVRNMCRYIRTFMITIQLSSRLQIPPSTMLGIPVPKLSQYRPEVRCYRTMKKKTQYSIGRRMTNNDHEPRSFCASPGPGRGTLVSAGGG